MLYRATAVLSLVLLAACGGGDPDEDGLTNKEEKDLGLDPKSADTDGDGVRDGDELLFGSDPLNQDTDGDGLTDGEEWQLGSDPNSEDSDEDTYLDLWEVMEGTDPADPKSRIYKGGWSYNPDKDGLNNVNWNTPFEVGETFPRFKFKDQYGDKVDLFDLAGGGRQIVIDVSAEWCPPCHAMADWLDGADDPYYDDTYPGIRKAVNKGNLVWLTIIGENANGGDALREDCKEWHDQHPNEYIPVLADTDREIVSHISLEWWPSLFVLDEDLTIAATQHDDFMSAID